MVEGSVTASQALNLLSNKSQLVSIIRQLYNNADVKLNILNNIGKS